MIAPRTGTLAGQITDYGARLLLQDPQRAIRADSLESVLSLRRSRIHAVSRGTRRME